MLKASGLLRRSSESRNMFCMSLAVVTVDLLLLCADDYQPVKLKFELSRPDVGNILELYPENYSGLM